MACTCSAAAAGWPHRLSTVMMRALVAVACSSAVEKSAVVTAVSRTMLIAAPTTVATWDAVARRDTCATVILSRSFTSLPNGGVGGFNFAFGVAGFFFVRWVERGAERRWASDP